jgi:membrane protein required for colicin V production
MDFDIGWVDACLLGVLVLSILVGAIRGLVFEILSLAGWLVAYFVALWAMPELAPHLPIGTAGSPLKLAASFASAFIVTLVVWSLVSRLIRSLVHATPLRPVDRLFGAGFGVLRGGLVLLVVAALVGLTPAVRSPAWQASIGACWLDAGLKELKPLVPSDVARFLPAQAPRQPDGD